MDLLSIGLLQKNHGVKGAFKVRSFSGESSHFFKLKEVFVKLQSTTENLKIEWVKKASRDLLIKFQGIDSPEAGKKYRNLELWVDRHHACPVNPDEYYMADITRCSVFNNDKEIGKVKSVFDSGAANIIEVKDKEGNVINIPFTQQFIKEVDLKEYRLYVNPESPLF
ncbi:MAG: 16S rRNA processing protein RimM [Spirochaetales bacterium]|nr:16S rRNA processing protein RimM [Spirochaetales bacterium]